jgi:hypothetical protein
MESKVTTVGRAAGNTCNWASEGCGARILLRGPTNRRAATQFESGLLISLVTADIVLLGTDVSQQHFAPCAMQCTLQDASVCRRDLEERGRCLVETLSLNFLGGTEEDH